MSDPYFANVVLLAINDNAANGTTTFVDQSASAKTITNAGTTAYSSTTAPTGMTTSAALNGSTKWLSAASHADFAWGTGDFTIELMVRGSAFSADQAFWDIGTYNDIYTSAGSSVVKFYNGAVRITGTTSLATNTWYHVALCRSGTSTKLFINGTQEGSTYTDSTNYAQAAAYAGSAAGAAAWNGYISNVRVTKGVARYTGNFTPPSLPLPTTGASGLSMAVAMHHLKMTRG